MIRAERTIGAPPGRVFAFLAQLQNHWQLHEALRDAQATSETTARVRLRGPFGISRLANTRIVETTEASRLRGVAEVIGGTVARVAWDLEPRGAGTHVRLSTEIQRASPRDRVVLALGGAFWLRRVYARALENLDRLLT